MRRAVIVGTLATWLVGGCTVLAGIDGNFSVGAMRDAGPDDRDTVDDRDATADSSAVRIPLDNPGFEQGCDGWNSVSNGSGSQADAQGVDASTACRLCGHSPNLQQSRVSPPYATGKYVMKAYFHADPDAAHNGTCFTQITNRGDDGLPAANYQDQIPPGGTWKQSKAEAIYDGGGRLAFELRCQDNTAAGQDSCALVDDVTVELVP